MEDKDILKAMRKEANMTQRQFAGYFGIPNRTVENWERGLRHMPDYLMRLLIYKMEMEGIPCNKKIHLVIMITMQLNFMKIQ